MTVDIDQSLLQGPVAIQWASIQEPISVEVNREASVRGNPSAGRASIPAALDRYIKGHL